MVDESPQLSVLLEGRGRFSSRVHVGLRESGLELLSKHDHEANVAAISTTRIPRHSQNSPLGGSGRLACLVKC